jgi:hypothetical protein
MAAPSDNRIKLATLIRKAHKVVVNEGTTDKIAQMELDRQAVSSSSSEDEDDEDDDTIPQPRPSLAALQRGSSKLLSAAARLGLGRSPRASYDISAGAAPPQRKQGSRPAERKQASLMMANKGPSKPKLNVTPREKVKVDVGGICRSELTRVFDMACFIGFVDQ